MYMTSSAIVGVGVDLLHLPRLQALISRQARRMTESTPPSVSSSSFSTSGTEPKSYIAAQQLARRVMHDREFAEWQSLRTSKAEDAERHATARQMQKIATTWAVKEAAFKAIAGVPHPRALHWHDAFLTYPEGTRRPILQYSEQLQSDWQQHHKLMHIPPPPLMHISISHDGDYVTAFVIAESRPAVYRRAHHDVLT